MTVRVWGLSALPAHVGWDIGHDVLANRLEQDSQGLYVYVVTRRICLCNGVDDL